jgi:hypothetical protein
LLIGSGRPVLIAGSAPTPALTGTITVCWKETAEAARAVNAAMPFLIRAKRVVIVSIVEDDENVADGRGPRPKLRPDERCADPVQCIGRPQNRCHHPPSCRSRTGQGLRPDVVHR